MRRYNPKEIEPKWQAKWEKDGTYTADLGSKRPKFYGFGMFNYPSGAGIHVGHVRNYTIPDVITRAKRQQGYATYQPVGWDSFGLPAENFAIKTGVPPQESTKKAIEKYQKQYRAMGWAVDWTKEINTTDPGYYKWTQWIFAKLFEHKLAYQKESAQWWCEKCKTVLADEQVINGKCWRHEAADDPNVTKKSLKQWFFKITDYADEMLEATDDLNWTQAVKASQKSWIGKSIGAQVDFVVACASAKRSEVRSYVMGQKNITEADIKQIGGRLEGTSDNGHLKIAFPKNATKEFEELISEKMEPGFWNEYISDEVVFIFKHKDGKLERFVLNDNNEDKIRKLGHEFNNQDDSDESPWEWLANNGWYAPVIPRVEVFTTRPDTLFGATFLVLAPEHELVSKITPNHNSKEVEEYVKQAQTKTELQRQENKEKTGVFTGAYAINPVNNEKIPIWIADYVLTGYGTGAIMAVPAHDERDFEFAKKFELPIRQVIRPCGDDPNNPPAPGLEVVERETVVIHLQDKATGKFALLNWHGTLEGITTAVMGGVDKGNTPEEAALAELREEAGLDNVSIVKESRWVTGAQYFASHKGQNRKSITHSFLAAVDNLKNQKPVDDAEKKLHTLVWVDQDQVLDALTPVEQKSIWGQIQKETAIVGEGEMINSSKYDGMESSEAREKVVADLEKQGKAKAVTNYKMRDWLISRQRYWGAPIPVIHCVDHGAVAVPEKDLPVVLPEIENYQPTGGNVSVLAGVDGWVNTPCPTCGKPGKRETDTMDGYVCSSWYFMRYLSPNDDTQAWDPKLTQDWMPVDFYNGADHATAHLLYARFFTRFFNKIGISATPEPFGKMVYNGKIKAADGSAFSKTLGNGVDPLEIIESGYGADALRLYEMFAAPVELDVLWDPQGVPGSHRFLSRVWTLAQEYLASKDTTTQPKVQAEILKFAHKSIKKVSSDVEGDKFNTAIATMMETVNEYYKVWHEHGIQQSAEWKFALESLLQLLAPFAPHISEELWQELGNNSSIHIDNWPVHDEKYLVSDNVTMVVQVNGKVRASLSLPVGSDQETVEKAAQADSKVAGYIKDGIKKTILVKNKLINFVV